MRKLMLCFASGIVLHAAAYAQKGTAALAGQLKKDDITTPLHIRNMDGADLTIPVEADGTFSGKINIPAKGFYDVSGVGNIYLEPGYALNIVYAPDSTYRFTGKGAVENNAFVSASKKLGNYLALGEETLLAQEALYIPMPEFLAKLDAFLDGGKKEFAKSSNASFREIAEKDLAFYAKYVMHMYAIYYGTDLVKQAEFYKFMQSGDRADSNYQRKFRALDSAQRVKRLTKEEKAKLTDLYDVQWDKNDAQLFKQSYWYRYMLSSHLSALQWGKYRDLWMAEGTGRDRRSLIDLTIVQHEVKDPFILSNLRHRHVTNALKMLGDKALRDSLYQNYMATVKRADYRKAVEEIYANANTFGDNKQAPDFTYEDINGKNVSLRDLRGKYVYIDVWATWCGPCKAEIPHLEKVEKAFHGKDITFVSLSVDKQSDKGKWVEFVKNGTLNSIQVLADKDFGSDFVKKFNINAIPRFILISPDGKIVSANALRPSDPKLTEMLEKLLSKG
ncbi:TlpA disulfide reductase family protein [Chitinophaga caseinilytica]|uniref:TlpA disulfide reductase family protein n=1 Tax=Chitinophaga caseinilytica TaxID=2267521 RepID=A0ABZ2ZB99_9BACT